MPTLASNESYRNLLAEIKQRIQQSQLKATLSINNEMLILYWHIGKSILQRQEKEGWGAKVINQLSRDLKEAFPNANGLGVRTLKYMRKFALEYPHFEIVQPVVAQISWTHNLILLDKCKDDKERLWYAQKALQNGWSKRAMAEQIKKKLYQREGKAITNFSKNLPAPQSEMAQQALKDPYLLGFLGLQEEFLEREMEDAIVKHMTSFLFELGKGFAFVGRQYPITVGGKDYRIDLLFYNIILHCYIAVELKAKAFKPEYVGKMNFYLSALDDTIKGELDYPSFGLILCREKDAFTVKYALKDVNKPIGISTFETLNSLPEKFKSQLPSIEDLERELNEIIIIDDDDDDDDDDDE